MYGIEHAHSTFSLHDSGQSPLELVLKAKELGVTNVTLTDHGTLLGIDDFMKAGKEHNINTIPGLEAYLEDRSHLILIAKNLDGYKAISFALRDANENQIKIRKLVYPLMKVDTISKYLAYNDNIIVTSACINGPLGKILLTKKRIEKELKTKQKKAKRLEEAYRTWKNAFQNYKTYVTEEKNLKREKKEYTVYTKPVFLKKAEKNQELMEKYTLAVSQLEKIEKELGSVIKCRREYKNISDKLETKGKKYEKLMQEIQRTVLPDEKILYQQALERAKEYKDLFPNFYIEMQYHFMEDEAYVMTALYHIAKELDIPLIAANDAHMASRGDEVTRQILRYNYFERHQDISKADKELYVKSEEELKDTLLQILPSDAVKEAINNTSVLDTCHVEFEKECHYPKCNSNQNIWELIDVGVNRLKEKGEWTEEYQERLEYEIKTIEEMGYIDYHMVVQDYCRMIRILSVIPKRELDGMPRNFSKIEDWIKEKGFRSGMIRSPGRGSAAGSLVCYLLGITNLDPIKCELLFDRYLNPERVTMPDIDTDVKRMLRPYIIKYLKWKYGKDAICSISTKTTYGAKNAILMAGRDRASELYQNDADHEELERRYMYEHTLKVSKLIPDEVGQTLEKTEALFYEQYGSEQEKCVIWEHAKLIEGKLSGTGVHAGGVVIADNGNINEYVPLAWREDKKVWAAQCDMVQIEERGLLKMDLLGLNTQDCISETLQLIERHHGIVLDINDIPFETEVFEHIYAKGHTNSVFQFESSGMKDMLRRFKPDCFEDLIILIAMYRPGPMQYMERVIATKNKEIPLEIKIDKLRPLLEPTYGAIIYQEQVMKIFQTLAGYSLGQADLVRRAMSKKKEDKLKIERNAFLYGDVQRNIKGCIKNGICEEDANALFDDIMEFAKYCFNKSHAAAYALVSYQTAYLKYHYPAEFYCAMFNNVDDEFLPIIEDCMKDKIALLPPDVNNSYYEFTIEEGAIRFGFSGIKGVGNEQLPDYITNKRSDLGAKGMYQSLTDFFVRTSNVEEFKVLPKKFIEALILAGCFDVFTRNRNELLERYKLLQKIKANNKNSFFASIKNILENPFDGYDKKWNREHEIKVLGALLSENPLLDYKSPSAYGCTDFEKLENGTHYVMGFLSEIEEKRSKKGNIMKIAHLLGTSRFDVIFMNDVLRPEFENTVVRIKGQFKDGTFFGRQIEYLPNKIEPYYLVLDTKEKTIFVTSVMEKHIEGILPVTIEFHFNKNLEPILPKVSTFTLDLQTIKNIGAKKIKYLRL